MRYSIGWYPAISRPALIWGEQHVNNNTGMLVFFYCSERVMCGLIYSFGHRKSRVSVLLLVGDLSDPFTKKLAIPSILL